MNQKRSCIMIVSLLFVGTTVVLSGCTSVNSDDNPKDSSWLDTYTPVHLSGTGSNDFWITYPAGHPSSGAEVEHFDWIVNDLKNKPVLFVVHITGCVGCADQAERVIKLAQKYFKEVRFYDLDAVYGAPNDITQKANEVYRYDPNGAPGYIALTGIFTYIKENDEVKIGWHTWEAPNDMTVSDADLDIWIKDAIYYYHVNQ